MPRVQANRPPRVPTQIMYHGTSSTFLPSILAQGLLPDPPRRVWAEDKAARESGFQATRRSLKGVYLSDKLFQARKGAYNAVRQFGGHELIVIAQIQMRAAYADEDDLRCQLERAVARWRSVSLGIRGMAEYNTYALGYLDGTTADRRRQLEAAFVTQAHAEVPGEQERVPPAKEALVDWLYAHLRAMHYKLKRRSHDKADWAYNWGYSAAAEISRYADVPQPDVDIVDAEADYLAAFDKLTRRYKRVGMRPVRQWAEMDHTLRLNLPVGFRGQNQILAILEDRTDDRDGLAVHYAKHVPKEFVEEWTRRRGAAPRLGRFVGKAFVPFDADDVDAAESS